MPTDTLDTPAQACDSTWADRTAAGLDELVRHQTVDTLGTTAPLAAQTTIHSDPSYIASHYRIVRKLGQGGMGAVYLAEDERTGWQVAVKILPRQSTPDENAIRRFQKECRLLAEVRHPNVANLLEFGDEAGACFLVMELVEGVDLKEFLSRAGTALPERLAVEIVRDVASALAVAHERGIVHRDIKPGNILIAAPQTESVETSASPPRVKLTDFGLARHVDQSASLDMTRTGMMLGTPYYVSPEQCTDRGRIGPPADIYSLGATLFELLTGRPPFVSDDPVRLISMHCFEEPPDPRKINPLVSDGVAEILSRALAKTPESRQADGAQLAGELARHLAGEVVAADPHPHVPAACGKVFEAAWQWELESSAATLWPLVSNTERINAAVGLPAVQYTTERDAAGALHKFGSFRLGFSTLTWEEHPFEWVEGHRLGVLREFRNGPFQWFLSVVELTPLPSGGTRLTHRVRIAAKGLIGRLLAHLEVNMKGKRALDRVYQRIDKVASGRIQGSPALDPFVPLSVPAKASAKRFALRQTRLEEQPVSVDYADRLVQFLKESPAQELARIRPGRLARQLDIPADTMLELCLHACHAGLLALNWDILCPTCRVSSDVKDTLSAIDKHTRCEACDLDFEVDFANSVELVFRVHPELREADPKTYCIGGPEHAPHVVAQSRLAVGEAVELPCNLDAGSYVLRGPQLPYTARFVVEAATGRTRDTLRLHPRFDVNRTTTLLAGRQTLTLQNDHDRPLLVRLERCLTRRDITTAAQAGALPLFRRLFPAEVLGRESLSNYSACTLFAVRATNLAELCDSHGDAVAQGLLLDRFRRLKERCEAAGGKIVKDQEDRMLIAFTGTLDAVRLAVETIPSLHDDGAASVQVATAPELQLRIGLHRGAAMSTSVNGRVDYFGRTIALATRLLEQSLESAVMLSDELSRDAEITEFLQSVHLACEPQTGPSAAGAETIHRLVRRTAN